MRLLKNHGDFSLAACCDHRGRIVANFWVMRSQDDFLLILPTTMLEITKDHLQKYAMFSKVAVTIADQFVIALSSIPTEQCVALPDKKNYLTVNPPHTHTLSPIHQILINNQLVLIQPQTSLLFTPQMINLEKLGGVSFNKGCYVGQEIVARTQHLGILKRHLHQRTLKSEKIIYPGDPLIENTIEIGVIADAIQLDEQCYDALVVIEDRYT